MNFQQIKEPLLDNYDNILEIYNILKNATGTRYIDILHYDNKKSIFFDNINKTTLQMKFLDDSSIIGRVIIDKKPLFIEDMDSNILSNSAIDNPFKLDLKNQIIIPILNHKQEIIGVLRLSTLPTAFNRIDFKSLILLMDVFVKIFEANSYSHEDDDLSEELMKKRLENYNLIKELNKLYDMLSNNKTNPELQKLINNGRENVVDIFTYLNPSITKSAKINEEINRFKKNGLSCEKKVNILIADDIRINVQILNAMLSSYHNIGSIKFAYDGLEAIDVINDCSDGDKIIHVIFLDHHMPGKLDSDIARELKSDKFKDKNITIVSITNDLEILNKNRHLYDHHIPKPFTKNGVKSIMDKIY